MNMFGIDLKKFAKVGMLVGAGASALYLSALAPKKFKLPSAVVGSGILGYAGYEGYKLYKSVDGGSIDSTFPIEDFPTQEVQDVLHQESGKTAFDVFYNDVFPSMHINRSFLGNFKVKVALNNNSSVSGNYHLVTIVTDSSSKKMVVKDDIIRIPPNSSNIYETKIQAQRDVIVGDATIQTFIWNRTWTRGCTLEAQPCVEFGHTDAIPIHFTWYN